MSTFTLNYVINIHIKLCHIFNELGLKLKLLSRKERMWI